MSSLRTRVLVASLVLAVVVGGIFAILLVAIGEERSSSDAARHSEQVLAAANRLERRVIDLETGLRGLLLTNDERFLSPFRSAQAAVPPELKNLQQLVHASPEQSARAKALAASISGYLKEYVVPQVLRGKVEPGSARARLVAGEGRTRVDALRAIFGQFIAAESARAEVRRASADDQARTAVLLGVLGMVVSVLLVLAFSAYLSTALLRPIGRVAGGARRLAGGDMAARVDERGAAELGELARTFNVMAGSLEENRDELESQNAELASKQSELEAALQVARHQARINRAVLDTANEAFVAMDAAGVVTAWNPAAERLFGWTAAEAIGRNVGGLIVPERDLPAHERELTRFLRTGEGAYVGQPLELVAIDRERNELPVEVTISPLNLDGRWVFNGFLRDITARRRSQLYLETQNAVARVLAEAATVEEALPRLIGALGESLDWQVGAYWSVDDQRDRLWLDGSWSGPEVDRDRWASVTRELVFAPGEGIAGQVWASGEIAWLEDLSEAPSLPLADVADGLGLHGMVAIPVRSGTTTLGVLQLLSLERRPRDDQLIALMAYLGQQIGQYVDRKASEREAEILKDQFFALVSHELRTPLTSIIGYLELVLEDGEALGPNHARFLSVVERNARRLLRLVGDLLFVAHVEAGRLALEIGEVELPTLTTEAVEAARPRAEAKELDLSVVAEALPPMAGDRDRLAQVLDNLVSNAVKFTPEHGQVNVSLTSRNGDAVIEVKDTGVGIPAAEQERLFERFFRASTATERAIPGVGLGLTIAKAIVEAHGGRLDFDSVEGAGTTFRVRLPLQAPPETLQGAERFRGSVSL